MPSLGWNVARSYLTSTAAFRLPTHSAENTLTSGQQQSTSLTMSGSEIAGLGLAGTQMGGSIISKLSSGGSYQEVATTTRMRPTCLHLSFQLLNEKP